VSVSTRVQVSILLAFLAGWVLRVLAELDSRLFEPVISLIGLTAVLALFVLARDQS
jgi:hypothetical protein